MQFHVGSQQDYKLEVSHNRRYSPSHAGSHEKGKKASISPPCSRRTLRCIQLQDPIDQSQQLGNRTTADQLLLSMRASVEDRQRCLLHRWTKGRCHSRAEATKQFSCSDHEIWHFQAFLEQLEYQIQNRSSGLENSLTWLCFTQSRILQK